MLVRTRTNTGSLAHLDELLTGIKSANQRFDHGRHDEARTLAAHVGALLHRNGEDAGLIAALGLQDTLTWVDTAGVPNPKTTCSTAGLTLMRIRGRHHGTGEYVPKLAMYPPAPIRTRDGDRIDSGSRIPFDHWWTNPVVTTVEGAQYSRKQLVLAMADHDDTEARAARDALVECASLGWVARATGTDTSRPLCASPVIASIRQIGYEVLQTFTEQRDVVEASRKVA